MFPGWNGIPRSAGVRRDRGGGDALFSSLLNKEEGSFYILELRLFCLAFQSPEPRLRIFMLPSQFGSFDLVRGPDGNCVMLGAGGAGSTYLARHRFLETKAAIKVMGEAVSSQPESRERFLREARAVARLDHPNIARVQDFGEAGAHLFYAMEYCGGGSLAERVARVGPLPLSDIVSIAKQVGDALKSCHAQGFIHRDLKPSNLMLADPEGPLQVKLIDFGLVFSDSWDESREGSPPALGTLMYASPEQLREQKVDGRSDLFSLGMSLWHLALGCLPEEGDASMVLESRLSPGSYTGRLPAALPPPVRTLIERLLEKDPQKRFPTADKFLEALESVIAAAGPAFSGADGLQEKSAGRGDPLKRSGIEEKTVNVRVGEVFAIEHSEGENGQGPTYRVRDLGGGGKKYWLQLFKFPSSRSAEGIEWIRGNALRVGDLNLERMCLPQMIVHAVDAPAVAFALPSGESLLDVLRRNGKLQVAPAMRLMLGVAEACEALSNGGLPLPDLRPGAIFIRMELLEVFVIPRLVESSFFEENRPASGSADVVVTMAGDFSGGMGQVENPQSALARLFYRVIAGRDCPVAASSSVYAYVPIPELSEEGNRHLAKILAGKQKADSCAGVFHQMATLEGLGDLHSPKGSLGPIKAVSPGTNARALDAEDPPVRTGEAVSPAVAPAPVPRPAPPSVLDAAASGGAEARGPVSKEMALPGGQEGKALESLPSRSGPRRRLVLAGGALAGVVALGLLFFSKPGASESEMMCRMKLSSTVSEGLRVFVGGIEMKPSVEGETVAVPLGKSQRFPLKMRLEKPGCDGVELVINRSGELSEIRDVAFRRSEGALVLRRSEVMDYDTVQFSWDGPLEGDSGVDDPSPLPGVELDGRGDKTVKLPTGKYKVVLMGSPSTVRARVFQTIQVEKNASVSVQLPGSFAGRYELVSGADEGSLEISPGLRESKMSFTTGTGVQKGKMSEVSLDPKGELNATFIHGDFAGDLKLVQIEGGNVVAATLRPRQGGDFIELRFRRH